MLEKPLPIPAPTDQLDSLLAVLNVVREDRARTRPRIAEILGLGRNLVSQRVGWLLEAQLLVDGQLGRSNGGRAPREVRFNAEAGYILVAELDAAYITVAVANLQGQLSEFQREAVSIGDGPKAVLGRVSELFDTFVAERPNLPVWGVGIGLPGPVEFATGRPVAPPIMPGWDSYDVREHFASSYNAPVWVDNDVNVMAMGELRKGRGPWDQDVIYIKVGAGIGAGLISQGRLHRGAQGCAGDIGHIPADDASSVLCRCGKTGCLEALAGGTALIRDATAIAHAGGSERLARILDSGRAIVLADVISAARHGDRECTQLIIRSAQLVGEMTSRLVSVFNPSLILIGGDVSAAGDPFLAEVRQVVFRRAPPLATRSLKIDAAPDGDQAGLRGCAFMVIDSLFSKQVAQHWMNDGSPSGRADLAA